jgi:hypothetical protein
VNEADVYNSVDSPAGKYFKLKDGEEALIRITSDSSKALIYQNTFTDKNTGEVTMSNRFAYVIWNHTAKRAQVWSGVSGATYDKIKKYITNPSYGDITQYDITVSREGELLQTKYDIVAGRENYELTPAQLEECAKIDLLNEVSEDPKAAFVMTLYAYHVQSEEGREEYRKEHERKDAERLASPADKARARRESSDPLPEQIPPDAEEELPPEE